MKNYKFYKMLHVSQINNVIGLSNFRVLSYITVRVSGVAVKSDVLICF